MLNFDFRPRTRVVFGAGEFSRLGELAREMDAKRALVVADPGMVSAGYAQAAIRSLKARRIEVAAFHDFGVNPDTDMVEAGRVAAAAHQPDLIVALGGGSSMDCAKGINFVLSNGGHIVDYWGYGKAAKPMLPMIAVPTTAGTGSEAQSYALISDAVTHVKMACGDVKVSFRTAILDPQLTTTQPREVTAATGYDALSHAVETFVTTRRSGLSECFSRSAWRLLSQNFERVLNEPEDLEARGAMLLGAHFAGLAIENSMLGATHACANPLTANFNVTHGVAISVLLPHVVRWNSTVENRYQELYSKDLAEFLEKLAEAAGLPGTLKDAGVSKESLPRLAEEAATQWTGKFNPRALDAAGALEIYECAY